MSGSRYVLDANVFIQAKNDYYRFSVCPGFWQVLAKTPDVCSIDKIHEELQAEKDQICDWTDNLPGRFFKQTRDERVINQFQRIIAWASSEPQFFDSARADFAGKADGWIVAYAKANGLTVVTHEKYEPAIKREIKIPNVCVEFDVEYINTFDMLENLKAKFVASPKASRKKR